MILLVSVLVFALLHAVPGGPLDPGMYYQFRATAWRSPGGKPGPVSTTEDLRGVFYVQP